VFNNKGVVFMPTQEERLSTLEQTITSLRHDFLQAITENTRSMSTLNKVVLQQEQNARDANHDITILTGVISSQGRDIKNIKNSIDGFEQRFASIEGKLEQVLQILTTPPKADK
jgi:hypothetical protein